MWYIKVVFVICSIKSGKEMVSIGRECNCECNIIEGLQGKQKQDALTQRTPFNSEYGTQSHRTSLNLTASRQGEKRKQESLCLI